MSTRLAILGYENHISPLYEIRNWFASNGYILDDKNPDIIIELCGFYDRALDLASHNPKALKIFNLLDCAPLNPAWPEKKAKDQLIQGDVITTISETSAAAIKKRIGIDCDVIYYPIKNIFFQKPPAKSGSEYLLFVGRFYDPIKNYALALNTALHLHKKLISIGPDRINPATKEMNPSKFEFWSNVSEEKLVEYYVNAEFLLFPSLVEGLGLPPIESVLCGTFPILNEKNACAAEFGLEDFAAEPNLNAMLEKVNETKNNPKKFNDKLLELKSYYFRIFTVEVFCRRLTNYF